MSKIRFVTLSSETDINKTVQEALTQKNGTTTIVLGCANKGKETPLMASCLRTTPERISVEEIDEIKFIQNPSEQR
ncbi:hypothetical protein K5Z09_004803 [Escherichia coli]|uniref:hypothetical protein n=1 Tax=Escherichia coli TaxID=562 RepID=UPI000952C5A5|nr:hypothetical protein [Escherichia coli]EAS2965988.1 hypothetical protein [Salmonella enterica]EGC6482342.1 hypothetical protein [Salmonella enterica subsp. enterica serovar Typhimurium]EGS9704755.1 hypothetical protein [Salmonella enterica subsp. enterica serovar Ohio]EHF5861096.1 hypothetical protein [Salmonella enterica subsp. enterica serovar Infantis]EIP3410101.1 hypothetical protein [Salmonella enterica subsp. enterica serovar Anatum]